MTTTTTTTTALDELQVCPRSGAKGHPNGQTVRVDDGEARFSRKRVVGRGKGKEMCGWMWVV